MLRDTLLLIAREVGNNSVDRTRSIIIKGNNFECRSVLFCLEISVVAPFANRCNEALAGSVGYQREQRKRQQTCQGRTKLIFTQEISPVMMMPLLV